VVVRVLSKGAGFRAGAVLLPLFAVALCSLAIPSTSFAASAPTIGSTSAEVSQNEATLKAPIRPYGLETTYEIWLQCTSQSCTSTEGQRVADGSIEAGRLEQEVSVALTSLEWDSSYRFEVVASNKDGTARSYPQAFTTGSPPPIGCPDGCSENKPAEFKVEPWNEEGAAREANEAPRIGAEEEAKAKEEAERPAKEPPREPPRNAKSAKPANGRVEKQRNGKPRRRKKKRQRLRPAQYGASCRSSRATRSQWREARSARRIAAWARSADPESVNASRSSARRAFAPAANLRRERRSPSGLGRRAAEVRAQLR
jgi:hypothetical protein